jgi:signal peptidase I
MIILQGFFPDKATDIIGFRMCLIANTGSMEPELKYNDLIIVKKVDFNTLEKGDTISFNMRVKNKDGGYGNYLVTHKIIAVNINTETGTRSYRTKGANEKVGSDIKPVTVNGSDNSNRYVGKVVFKSRFIGNLFAYVKSIPGLVTIFVNAAGIIAIYYVVKLFGKKAEPAAEPAGVSAAQEKAADSRTLKAKPDKPAEEKVKNIRPRKIERYFPGEIGNKNAKKPRVLVVKDYTVSQSDSIGRVS